MVYFFIQHQNEKPRGSPDPALALNALERRSCEWLQPPAPPHTHRPPPSTPQPPIAFWIFGGVSTRARVLWIGGSTDKRREIVQVRCTFERPLRTGGAGEEGEAQEAGGGVGNASHLWRWGRVGDRGDRLTSVTGENEQPAKVQKRFRGNRERNKVIGRERFGTMPLTKGKIGFKNRIASSFHTPLSHSHIARSHKSWRGGTIRDVYWYLPQPLAS